MERLTRIENDAEQGQRHVDPDRLPVPGLDSTPAAAMLRHGGFSFVGWHPCPTTRQVKESPPLSVQVQQIPSGPHCRRDGHPPPVVEFHPVFDSDPVHHFCFGRARFLGYRGGRRLLSGHASPVRPVAEVLPRQVDGWCVITNMSRPEGISFAPTPFSSVQQQFGGRHPLAWLRTCRQHNANIARPATPEARAVGTRMYGASMRTMDVLQNRLFVANPHGFGRRPCCGSTTR